MEEGVSGDSGRPKFSALERLLSRPERFGNATLATHS